MHFKVKYDYFMLIFAVWSRNPIHACLSIPNYHHWNYVVRDSPLYWNFKIWVQVDYTCFHQCQHRCYVEELKQSSHQLPPRRLAKSRGWELISLIANFYLLPPLWAWLSLFGVFIYICMTLMQTIIHTKNKAWHYCRKYLKKVNNIIKN